VADRERLVGRGAGLHFLQDAIVAGQAGERRGLADLLRATQHRPDPGDKLHRVERLEDIVVGTGRQADDLVDGLSLRGQHDDRHRRGRRVAA
jgi:hypothetical protein